MLGLSRKKPAARRSARALFETLERRAHLSVSRDSNGWTVVTPAADTKTIYVSNSGGSDSNAGTSTSPIKTLSKAQSLVRDGMADWVLLKRGDTFESLGVWSKKGRSANEPIYISTYGTGARPKINSGASYGFRTSGSTSRVDNVIINSLVFNANTYNGLNSTDGNCVGIQLLAPGSNITIEDCKIFGYKDNIVIGDSSNNATHAVTDSTIRRCEVLDAYCLIDPVTFPLTYRSQGIYISSIPQRITIEENVIDHNGWRANTPADRTTGLNHNIYAYNGAQTIVVRNNISTQAAYYGLKFNAGGTATGNLLARNTVSVYLENTATVNDNVITEAVEFIDGNTAWGIDNNTAPSATIRHNLITKIATASTAGNLIGINLRSTGAFSGLIEQNVIYNWKTTGIDASTKGNGMGSVTIQNNQIQVSSSTTTNPAALRQGSSSSTVAQNTFVYHGNTYYAAGQSNANTIKSSRKTLADWKTATGESDAQYQALTYPDPTRDLERYSQFVGGTATFDSFINTARGMDKLNWNSAYTAAAANAWLWQGFGDVLAPTVASTTFGYDAQPLKLDVKFSEDVGTSLSTGDLLVTNLGTGATVPFTLASYDSSTATGHFTFAGALPDGNYLASIPAGAVKDLSNNPMAGAYSYPFFTASGDANHDRFVNALDFNSIASNFGKTGRTFAQGDFNYDGQVNGLDFALLAARFNGAVAAPLPGPTLVTAAIDMRLGSLAAELLG